ncbi:hypothetical protein ASE62_11425 [Rhizobium sp. Leaf202]|nr:hypothetical protein ASE62_11425 [Rhizobium sp. Leaf202]
MQVEEGLSIQAMCLITSASDLDSPAGLMCSGSSKGRAKHSRSIHRDGWSWGDAAAAIDFARSSRGLIYTFENWLQPYFASGDLEPILPEWWTTFDGLSLYFSRRFMPAPLRAFIDFVGSERRD